MARSVDPHLLSSRLLAQDFLESDGDYAAYREKLSASLASARRIENGAKWVCSAAGTLGAILMFVGGSGIFGAFDPTSKDATGLSITLGVVYVASIIVFWVLLASYFSRWRPQIRRAEENLRDLRWLQMEARLDALQKDVAALKRQLSSS